MAVQLQPNSFTVLIPDHRHQDEGVRKERKSEIRIKSSKNETIVEQHC